MKRKKNILPLYTTTHTRDATAYEYSVSDFAVAAYFCRSKPHTVWMSNHRYIKRLNDMCKMNKNQEAVCGIRVYSKARRQSLPFAHWLAVRVCAVSIQIGMRARNCAGLKQHELFASPLPHNTHWNHRSNIVIDVSNSSAVFVHRGNLGPPVNLISPKVRRVPTEIFF